MQKNYHFVHASGTQGGSDGIGQGYKSRVKNTTHTTPHRWLNKQRVLPLAAIMLEMRTWAGLSLSVNCLALGGWAAAVVILGFGNTGRESWNLGLASGRLW